MTTCRIANSEHSCPEDLYLWGLCRRHYRSREHDYHPQLTSKILSQTQEDDSGCLVWTRELWKSSKVPQIRQNGNYESAHRRIWAERYGYPGSTYHVVRTCKNQLCLNIEHMVLENSKTRYRGVSYIKSRKKRPWEASKMVNGKSTKTYHSTEEEAIQARLEMDAGERP